MHDSRLTLRIASWQDDKEALKNIRRQVFIKEQNVPEEMEWDEFDESARHFIAHINDTAVAVARLKTDGQIGRMAVLAEFRQRGIGSKLLSFILKNTRQQKQLYLHAQTSAISFYEKQGFKVQGNVFDEAGIKHQKMLKTSS